MCTAREDMAEESAAWAAVDELFAQVQQDAVLAKKARCDDEGTAEPPVAAAAEVEAAAARKTSPDDESAGTHAMTVTLAPLLLPLADTALGRAGNGAETSASMPVQTSQIACAPGSAWAASAMCAAPPVASPASGLLESLPSLSHASPTRFHLRRDAPALDTVEQLVPPMPPPPPPLQVSVMCAPSAAPAPPRTSPRLAAAATPTADRGDLPAHLLSSHPRPRLPPLHSPRFPSAPAAMEVAVQTSFAAESVPPPRYSIRPTPAHLSAKIERKMEVERKAEAAAAFNAGPSKSTRNRCSSAILDQYSRYLPHLTAPPKRLRVATARHSASLSSKRASDDSMLSADPTMPRDAGRNNRVSASGHVCEALASPSAGHAPAGGGVHPARTPLLQPSAMQRLTPTLSPAEGVGGSNAAASEHRNLRPIAAHLAAEADAAKSAAASAEVRTPAAAAQQRPQGNPLQLSKTKSKAAAR